MSERFRSLVISPDDEFREELIQRAISLNFSVRSVSRGQDLQRILRRYGFDWFIVDVALGPTGCGEVMTQAAEQQVQPRIILVGEATAESVDATRRSAAEIGLEVVGWIGRPLSLPKLKALLAEVAARPPALLEGDRPFGPLTGIPSEELVVHYQPIVAMADRGLRRVEALVRWQHPLHGLIRPAHFIALMEEAGIIAPLTWQVLVRAIDQHCLWKRAGIAVGVSVNVSALFLASLGTADEILALLRDRGVEPRHLILEITESEATVNPSVAKALLARLRAAGVEISMDDYGVGFSDLQRLRYFPFSDLKVDRWLVAGLDDGDEARDVVHMLATMAREQGFTLTGEGIETAEQWRALRDLGCDYGQGFLIARPMPANQLLAWIDGAQNRSW